MKKQFIIILILTFALGLTPINFSTAITQNKINAEVQIVCTDGNDNWFSGSGTIIDPKGIILTNRHVIEGAYQNTCVIGFIESLDQEPNFYTDGNLNLAEVKYYTTSNNMDAALLYLENLTNKIYPYINIWDANSNNLQLGEDLEVIGFPGVGGSTITYTSGDFSGHGSASNGTQNYLKTTAWLGHGNSGGAAYKSSGNFIGIPTMSITVNGDSMNYLLSINSIKNWLSGLLGNQYENQITEVQPTIQNTNINLQDDITPPIIKNAPRDAFWYNAYDESGNTIEWIYGVGYDKFLDMNVVDGYRTIEITMRNSLCDNPYSYCLSDMDTSGINKIYYSFSNNISDLMSNRGTEYTIRNDSETSYLTPKITFPDIEGTYYIGLRFKDVAGNISNPYILTYVYEKNSYLKLKNIKFYSDSNYSNMIGNYDYDMESWEGYLYPQYHKFCVTNKKEIFVKWEYENNYSEYAAAHYNEFVNEWSASQTLIKGGIKITNNNKYQISNLDQPKENNEYYGYNICENVNDDWCHTKGKITSFLLKPKTSDSEALEGIHKVVDFAYDPNYHSAIRCGEDNIKKGKNNFGTVYIVLEDSKPLIEDSSTFDSVQQKIANSLTTVQENNTTQQETSSKNSVDTVFAKKQNGLILLQVEKNGEAYYIYPDDSKKYYLGRPDDAFRVMRELGLGATHNFITSHSVYPSNVLGKILLDVEQNGEAYYIYPKDKKAYYLGRPADAFRIMRELGLGITNSDLNKIPEGNL